MGKYRLELERQRLGKALGEPGQQIEGHEGATEQHHKAVDEFAEGIDSRGPERHAGDNGSSRKLMAKPSQMAGKPTAGWRRLRR